MAWVPLISTCGAMAGPLVPLVCQLGPAFNRSSTLGPLRLNALTLCFAAALLIVLVNVAAIGLFFRPRFPAAAGAGGQPRSWEGRVPVLPGQVVNTRTHVRRTFAHLALATLAMNFSIGVRHS